MIHNDQELKATQERIAYFQRLLSQLRVTATPEEFPLVAGGVPGRTCPHARGSPCVLDATCK
jgi:hypothetical protein